MHRRRGGARWIAVGALAVAGLVVTACSDPGYRYVNNSKEGAFFRVPNGYKVYRIKEERPEGRPASTAAGTGSQTWRVAFDSDPAPNADHANEDAPAHVTGQAIIFPLTANVGDSVSLIDLRSFFLGDDPIQLYQSGDANIEIVDFERITTGDGLRGSRVVMNVRGSDGTWATYDQTTLMDDKATHAYLFDIRCESTCFKESRDQIQRIVDSWQVRKR